MSAKFLYLTDPSWRHAWERGPTVPLFSASEYQSPDRQGTRTPDENRLQWGINVSGDDVEVIGRSINFTGGGGLFGRRLLLPGGEEREFVGISVTQWHGYILSLANSESELICRGLRKTTCVVIPDPEALLARLSEHFGVRGEMRACEYTDSAKRDVFTKSTRDRWQDEFRMYWNVAVVESPVWARVPVGVARTVWILEPYCYGA